MRFLYKFADKRFFIWLMVFAFLLLTLNIVVSYYEERNLKNEKEIRTSSFIHSIDSGDYGNSAAEWPYVYPVIKQDETFLAEFSDVLCEKYEEYYKISYLDGLNDEGLRMIASSYFSFVFPEKFDAIVTNIYDDFIYEKIDYSEFRRAMDEFFFFSGYTSVRIIELQEEAAGIIESRGYFHTARELALVPAYENAIETMGLVSPKDPIYYPLALELIDEYIVSLRELLKDGG